MTATVLPKGGSPTCARAGRLMQMTLALAAVTILLTACMTSIPAGSSGGLPYNEQIMYGNVAKTPALIETDRKFIDSFAARGLTRRQG